MSTLETFLDLINATSLPVSVSGHMHFAKPDGTIAGLFGQDRVPANLFPLRETKRELRTNDTFGPSGSISLRSAALRSSLVSKLKQQFTITGSTMFNLIWKEVDTPLQRRVSLLRASALHTSGSDFSSWVTPNTRDWKDTPGQKVHAVDPDGSSRTRLDQLPRQAYTLTPNRLTVSGEMQIGSCAEMENAGQLNPALSRWVMGLPPEWDDCAPMEMQSSRKSHNLS